MMKGGSCSIETAYRLSKDTGIHHSVILRFKNGERSLTLSTASKLVEALGLELVQKKRKKKGKK